MNGMRMTTQDHSATKKYVLKIKMVLKWGDIYVEIIRNVSMMAGL